MRWPPTNDLLFSATIATDILGPTLTALARDLIKFDAANLSALSNKNLRNKVANTAFSKCADGFDRGFYVGCEPGRN